MLVPDHQVQVLAPSPLTGCVILGKSLQPSALSPTYEAVMIMTAPSSQERYEDRRSSQQSRTQSKYYALVKVNIPRGL